MIECTICGREGALHCLTCAFSQLETPRLEILNALTRNEQIEKHATAVVEGPEDSNTQHVSLQDSKGGFLVDYQECSKNIELQRTQAETAEIEERTFMINEQADLLRQEIEDARKELAEKRRQSVLRQSDLSSATHNVDARRENERNKVQQDIKRLEYECDKTHAATVETRSHFCLSAADIAGLRFFKRRTKDGEVKETSHIGPDIDMHRKTSTRGKYLKIWDMRELNDAPSDELSASLLAVTQLLIRIAAYLGLRLPSEIVLPHQDYPYPTIFSPEESWQGKSIPFPKSTPSQSSSNSPEASRLLDGAPLRPLPRPMVLFIDRKLPLLRQEDKGAYTTFVEAVANLGYNVAWLCRSQGMNDEVDKWEDACDIGKNLHRLIKLRVTWYSQRPGNPLDKDVPQPKSGSNAAKKVPVGLGEISHATSHSFAGDIENVERLGEWKLSPWDLSDRLNHFLEIEEQTKDWDTLDRREWEGMANGVEEDPVVVGKRQESHMGTLPTVADPGTKTSDTPEGGEERKKGVNGWTRVKSRSEETGKKPTE